MKCECGEDVEKRDICRVCNIKGCVWCFRSEADCGQHKPEELSQAPWMCMLCDSLIPAGTVGSVGHKETCPRCIRATSPQYRTKLESKRPEIVATMVAPGVTIKGDIPDKDIAYDAKVLEMLMQPQRKRMPEERTGITHKFSIGSHEGYLNVGLYEDGTVGEIFVKMAKTGSTVSGFVDSWAILFSMALQYGVPLATLVKKFRHVAFEPSGWTSRGHAKSIVDYIAGWLEDRFLNEDAGSPKQPVGEERAVRVEQPERSERAESRTNTERDERVVREEQPVATARAAVDSKTGTGTRAGTTAKTETEKRAEKKRG